MKSKLLDGRSLKKWTDVSNYSNLKYLVGDYLTLALITAPAVYFMENRAEWGLSWLWVAPVVALVVLLVGAVQHRLVCLGHEAAHYTLLKNRFWNDLVSDLFCMFPVFGTTQAYRVHHIGHHLYPNDWEKDPNLLNGGETKHFDKFPMDRKSFINLYYLRFFWPPYLLRHLWDIFYVNALGSGVAPVPVEHNEEKPTKLVLKMKPATVLGMIYVLTLCGVLFYANQNGHSIFLAAPAVLLALGIATIALLPEKAFFETPVRSQYSKKFAPMIRLIFYTAFFSSMAYVRALTGLHIGIYVSLFWIVPVFTTFPYFMLLREIYQHANADGGELTNSRVFFADWFSKWAIYTYGQDIHLVHHIYPNVPHYSLLGLHHELLEKSPEYADSVVEVHGTFRGRDHYPTVIDVMSEAYSPLATERHNQAAKSSPVSQDRNRNRRRRRDSSTSAPFA